ncbi:MAG: flagellar biosynthetic protein FliO, partial [Gammaproteobacteria bacterium]
AAALGADASPAAASLVKLLVGLVGVIAAVLIFSRVLSRTSLLPSGHDKFRVLASLPVGARERIVLMQAGNRQIVVGVAPGQVSTLHVLDEPLDIGVRRPGTDASPAWLVRVLAGRER